MPYNIALKVAVIKSGKRQGQIASLSGLSGPVFSQIINGRIAATATEKKSIALGMRVQDLFPRVPDEASA